MTSPLFQALSGDVVHTVLVRCRRMYEDLQQQKKHMTSTWCPPQRVQLAVEGWTFCLCAYHFPDETLLVSSSNTLIFMVRFVLSVIGYA